MQASRSKDERINSRKTEGARVKVAIRMPWDKLVCAFAVELPRLPSLVSIVSSLKHKGSSTMKIIEAMKAVKANKEKIADLQNRIGQVSANLSFETPMYGTETKAKIDEWLQTCHDTGLENIRLLTAIARTNLATNVTITLGDRQVTKTIAEWVWRRREYSGIDLATWSKLTDRGLREGNLPTSTGVAQEVKIMRHYDPNTRDKKIEEFRTEPHKIDAALEVVNATTDLI